MGLYPVAVYYNKRQLTNNTPHLNKHSTQNYTNNKGHTTHNERHTIHNEQLQLELNKLIHIHSLYAFMA
jgi:hypothetical protein